MKASLFLAATTVLLTSIVFIFGRMAFCENLLSAPDASAILEEAKTSPELVLLDQDFETDPAPPMVEWFAGYGHVPHKIDYSGITEEQAYSGKRSYKIQLTFEAGIGGEGGASYIWLPCSIPVWSDVKVKMHVKLQSQPMPWYAHGLGYGDAEANTTGNLYRGEKTGEKNGWETWEATIKPGDSIGRYIMGPSVMFYLPERHPPTTVTVYVDKITVTGKLPSNWQEKWSGVYQYLTEYADRDKREGAEKRLETLRKWQEECQDRLERLSPPTESSPLLTNHYRSIVTEIGAGLKAVGPMIEQIENALADKNTRFSVNVNKPERILSLACHYLDMAAAYATYSKTYPDSDIITFTVEPTQSYRILPSGPTGHKDELTYYDWNEQGAGLENPQILPDTRPVPAKPSRLLKGFGCPGTYVPFSFAIHTGQDLVGVAVTASDLKSKEQTIQSAAVDIRVVAPWYRPFGGKPRLMNDLLLHDPEFVVPVASEQKNRYKDSKFGADAPGLLPVTIPAGKNRQFYVTVRIPEKAPSGIYTGQIKAKTGNGKTIIYNVELEVLPFDLEPTPYAYGAYYNRTHVRDIEQKEKEGVESADVFNIYKTMTQIQAELYNMAEHGMNTYCFSCKEGAGPVSEWGIKNGDVWDFSDSELNNLLSMAKRAGLTRSPFVWLSHVIFFLPDTRPGAPKTDQEVLQQIEQFVPAVNAFCRKNGYPTPALYGVDEASADLLMSIENAYRAVISAGGIVAAACYPTYYTEIGTALNLPIVYGGAQTAEGERAIRASQKLGYECWIYNTPATNMAASPSVYRRRYGLALWKNGEQGAMPWEFCGLLSYDLNLLDYTHRLYAFAFPTWSGKPIDTIIYEAYREGIYDTRYLATLQKYLKQVESLRKAATLTNEIETWLSNLSVHEDLQNIRRQMADYIVKLREVM